MRRLTEGRGCDGVVEASGTAEGIALACSLLGYGGTLACVGRPSGGAPAIDASLFYEKAATVVFGRAGAEAAAADAVRLATTRRYPVEALATHRLTFDEAQAAYELAAGGAAAEGRQGCVKALLYPRDGARGAPGSGGGGGGAAPINAGRAAKSAAELASLD